MGFLIFMGNRYLNLILITLCMCFLQTANKSNIEDLDTLHDKLSCKKPLGDDVGDECVQISDQNEPESPMPTIRDSVDVLLKNMDADESDYLIVDEMVESVKQFSEMAIGDAEALERANIYLKYLDDNVDSVIDIYELRLNLHSILRTSIKESLRKYEDHFVHWMKSFVGESPRKYPYYLVKIYQMFDEDMNGRLTWKEIRMAIKIAELFLAVSESRLMDERGKEDLVASIKMKYQQKWLSLDEFSSLLSQLGVRSDSTFYQWVIDYLDGDTEYGSSSMVMESSKNDFNNIDTNLDGLITKGELIAALHKHRKDYYTEQRINRKWTRADRNEDGKVTFNEYVFLENLKHPDRK